MYGMSALIGIFGLAVIIGGATIGGGDWMENLTSTVGMDFDAEDAFNAIYTVIRIAAFVGGVYFILVATFGALAMCCEKCLCTFCYGVFLSIGLLLTFIASIIFLGITGLTTDTIEALCQDDFS